MTAMVAVTNATQRASMAVLGRVAMTSGCIIRSSRSTPTVTAHRAAAAVLGTAVTTATTTCFRALERCAKVTVMVSGDDGGDEWGVHLGWEGWVEGKGSSARRLV